MQKKITTRQLLLVITLSILTLKVLFLPNVLATNFGRDGYIFLFVLLVVDFGTLLIFIYLINKYKDMTFVQILEKFFGKVIAKIILVLLFLYFIINIWTRFQTNYIYLNENLYTSLNWYTFAFPIIVVVLFCLKQGLNAFARLSEFFVPIIIGGFIVALIVGVIRADFSNALPILQNGLEMFKLTKQYPLWFGDYMFFIAFFGQIKVEKGFNKKVILWTLGVIASITLFDAVFYFTYNYNSVCHTNAISDIMQFLPSVSDIGSFDWILIMIWDVALFLDLTLSALASMYCFKNAFTKKGELIVAGIVLLLILLFNYLITFNVYLTINIAQNYLWIFIALMQVALPLIMLIFALFKNKKKEVNKNEVPSEK